MTEAISYFIDILHLKPGGTFKQPDETDIPSQSERFCEKYIDTFEDKVNEIAKKLNIKNPIKIIGKDCPKSNIWRNQHIQNYKAGRKHDSDIGEIFSLHIKKSFLPTLALLFATR